MFLKQVKSEMDDFEEEEKTLALSGSLSQNSDTVPLNTDLFCTYLILTQFGLEM